MTISAIVDSFTIASMLGTSRLKQHFGPVKTFFVTASIKLACTASVTLLMMTVVVAVLVAVTATVMKVVVTALVFSCFQQCHVCASPDCPFGTTTGKLERALGAANTPLLQPGVARAPRPNSGGRPSSAGKPNSPHSAMAAIGKSSPSSRPSSSLKRPSSSKHVAMLTDKDRAPSSSSAGESQSQTQEQGVSQAQTYTGTEGVLTSESIESAGLDEAAQAMPEAVIAAEAEAPAAAVAPSTQKPMKSSNLKSVIEQTMRRQMSSAYAETLSTSKYKVGQGFAKWISRAVGTAALKEKTEIQDLPAYRLRVSCLLPLCCILTWSCRSSTSADQAAGYPCMTVQTRSASAQ